MPLLPLFFLIGLAVACSTQPSMVMPSNASTTITPQSSMTQTLNTSSQTLGNSGGSELAGTSSYGSSYKGVGGTGYSGGGDLGGGSGDGGSSGLGNAPITIKTLPASSCKGSGLSVDANGVCESSYVRFSGFYLNPPPSTITAAVSTLTGKMLLSMNIFSTKGSTLLPQTVQFSVEENGLSSVLCTANFSKNPLNCTIDTASFPNGPGYILHADGYAAGVMYPDFAPPLNVAINNTAINGSLSTACAAQNIQGTSTASLVQLDDGTQICKITYNATPNTTACPTAQTQKQCPGGMIPYKNYTTTQACTCTGDCTTCLTCGPETQISTYHASFQNLAPETVQVANKNSCIQDAGTKTCPTSILQIGCVMPN